MFGNIHMLETSTYDEGASGETRLGNGQPYSFCFMRLPASRSILVVCICACNFECDCSFDGLLAYGLHPSLFRSRLCTTSAPHVSS